ncbi:hypothetical protein ACOME3_004808 [Neoechinorhynchus agilis]
MNNFYCLPVRPILSHIAISALAMLIFPLYGQRALLHSLMALELSDQQSAIYWPQMAARHSQIALKHCLRAFCFGAMYWIAVGMIVLLLKHNVHLDVVRLKYNSSF